MRCSSMRNQYQFHCIQSLMPVTSDEIETEGDIGQHRQYLRGLQESIRDTHNCIKRAEQTYIEALETLRLVDDLRL